MLWIFSQSLAGCRVKRAKRISLKRCNRARHAIGSSGSIRRVPHSGFDLRAATRPVKFDLKIEVRPTDLVASTFRHLREFSVPSWDWHEGRD
jgi:hypothetical protein